MLRTEQEDFIMQDFYATAWRRIPPQELDATGCLSCFHRRVRLGQSIFRTEERLTQKIGVATKLDVTFLLLSP